MKNFFNLTLSLFATTLFLSSCNKNDNINTENQDKGNCAVMTINFDNTITRTVGVPTSEVTITEGTILVFRMGSDILDDMVTFNRVVSPVHVKITVGNRDVYVVSNTGINLSSVQNVSDLKTFTNKYSLSSIAAAVTSILMSGEAIAQNASNAGVQASTNVKVTLEYIYSKVNIAWNITSLNADMSSLAVMGTYVMSVPSLTDAFGFGADKLAQYSIAFLTGVSNLASFASVTHTSPSPTWRWT